MININNITTKAFCDIYDLDTKYVGTKNYLGLAFFWNREYRHYMRDISSAKRKKIHNLFIQNNLDIAGKSNKHFEIIKKVTKFKGTRSGTPADSPYSFRSELILKTK